MLILLRVFFFAVSSYEEKQKGEGGEGEKEGRGEEGSHKSLIIM